MYRNVGKNLLSIAKFLFWIEFITSILLAIVLVIVGIGMIADADEGAGIAVIAAAVVEGIFGYAVAWVSNCVLASFGQLVENVNEIKKEIKEKTK